MPRRWPTRHRAATTSTACWPPGAGVTPTALGRLIGRKGKRLGLGTGAAAPARRWSPRRPGRRPRPSSCSASMADAARVQLRRRPLRRRARRRARPPAHPARRHRPRSWWSGTTRPPTPWPSGCSSPDDKNGRDLVVRRGFPTCALGVYRLDVDHWADVGRMRPALRPVHPALRRGLMQPRAERRSARGRAGWRRRPGRHHRRGRRQPCWRHAGAARAAQSAPPGCPTCRPGGRARWHHR